MTLYEINEVETTGFVSFHVFVFYSTDLNENTDETHQFNYGKTGTVDITGPPTNCLISGCWQYACYLHTVQKDYRNEAR